MQDMQGDQTQAAAEADESDHAAIIRLLNSETWTRRLEEARQSRNKILAQKQRPVSAPVFRPSAAQRVSRQDRLPPLEPAVPQVLQPADPPPERGVVIQLHPPGAVFHPAPQPVETAIAEQAPSDPDMLRLGQVAVAFLAGIVLGLVASVLF